MNRKHMMVGVLFALCSSFSVFWGMAAERSAKGRIADFKLAYYDTRCLLRHCDPYSADEMWNVYAAEGNKVPTDETRRRLIARSMPTQVYLPSAFLLISPFALLEWPTAHALWTTTTAIALTLASFLIFLIAAKHSADVSFGLIAFMLLNCGVLFAGGNAAGMAISLCVIAVWSFVEKRLVLLGVLCLGASLAIKPHDSGLIWLYFLLAGNAHRKRALQSLIVVAVLAVPAVIWVHQVAPNWLHEVQTNLLATSTEGGNADPGPSSGMTLGPGIIIDLQTVISVFRDNPRFYNIVAYSLCGPLLLMWAFFVIRRKSSTKRTWFALAAISALLLVPIYHRPYDAKILLLTIPACAALWASGGAFGRLALFLTTAGIVATSDIPLAVGYVLTESLHPSTDGLSGKIGAVLLTRFIPLILLASGIFYLWMYAKSCVGDAKESSPENLMEMERSSCRS